MTLLEKIELALSIADEVREMRDALASDTEVGDIAAAAADSHSRWRDTLEQKGYEIMTLLSTEND